MDKVFHIRAFCSPNGTFREVELDLPATDYELLDAMEQLQPEDGKRPYLESHAVEEYNYLDKRIQETDLSGSTPWPGGWRSWTGKAWPHSRGWSAWTSRQEKRQSPSAA